MPVSFNKDPREVRRTFERHEQRLEVVIPSSLERVGPTVREDCMADLQAKLKRPRQSTGNLEKNFQYEVMKTTEGWMLGIGKISVLKEKVPYFWVINFGAASIPRMFVPGTWKDGGGQPVPPSAGRFRQDFFEYLPGSKKGVWMFNVHASIEQKLFVQAGVRKADPAVEAILGESLRLIVSIHPSQTMRGV